MDPFKEVAFKDFSFLSWFYLLFHWFLLLSLLFSSLYLAWLIVLSFSGPLKWKLRSLMAGIFPLYKDQSYTCNSRLCFSCIPAKWYAVFHIHTVEYYLICLAIFIFNTAHWDIYAVKFPNTWNFFTYLKLLTSYLILLKSEDILCMTSVLFSLSKCVL